MAEKNPQITGERERHANDDPFAELSRIIGFSPRDGGNPAGIPAQSAPASHAAVDDLELEMERELLGSFAPEPQPLRATAPRDAFVRSPQTVPLAAEPAVPAEDEPDDLGIALDLDAELAASLREHAADVEEAVDFAALRGANNDEPPTVAGADADGPGEPRLLDEAQLLDESRLTALLEVEFGAADAVPADETGPGAPQVMPLDAALSADDGLAAAEAGRELVVDGVAISDPRAVAAVDIEALETVVAGGPADDAAPVIATEAESVNGDSSGAVLDDAAFGDFEAALLDSLNDDEAAAGHAPRGEAGPDRPALAVQAEADEAPAAAVAAEPAAPIGVSLDDAIALPGSPSLWRSQMRHEPVMRDASPVVAAAVPAPAVAVPPGFTPDASFEDELAAAFGDDILAEARQTQVSREIEQALESDLDHDLLQADDDDAPGAVPPVADPVAVRRPADGLAENGPDSGEGVEAEDAAADDLASRSADRHTVVEAIPDVVAGDGPGLEFDAAFEEQLDAELHAAPAEAPEPVTDDAMPLDRDQSSGARAVPAHADRAAAHEQVVAMTPDAAHADLDRQLAASLEAELADADMFADLELDLDASEPQSLVSADHVHEPAVAAVEMPAPAEAAGGNDFDAAVADVDADFSGVAQDELRAYEARDAAGAVDEATSALAHDLDDLLEEMKAQTRPGVASRDDATSTLAVAAVPAATAAVSAGQAPDDRRDDALDVFGDEDLFGLALREAAESDAVGMALEESLATPVHRFEDADVHPQGQVEAPEPAPMPAAAPASHGAPHDWNDTRLAAAFSDLAPEADEAADAAIDAEPETAHRPAAAVAAASSAMMAAPAPAVPPTPRDDPFAALAAMAARYKRSEPMTAQTGNSDMAPVARHQSAPAGGPAYDDAFESRPATHAAYDDMPDIDTAEVPESAVALADDLEIPELTFEEEPVVKADQYDDLDDEFSSLMAEMNHGDRDAPVPAGARHAAMAAETSAPRGYAAAAIAGAMASQAHPQAAQPLRQQPAQRAAAETDDFDPMFDEDLPLPAYEAIDPEPRPRRRGFFLASLLGGVALIGGVAAFALSSDNAGSGTPALVKADVQPIKVRPENPGGTVIPHQDNKVYETVAGKPDAAPAQQTLLTSAEAPVDISAPQAADGDLSFAGDEDSGPAIAGVEADAGAVAPVMAGPAGKNEDRVAADNSTVAEEEIALVEPRKVRTMVVKPDGTLVPREEVPEAAAPVPAAVQTAALAEPAQAAADAEPAFTIPGAEAADAAPAAADTRTTASTPAKVPVAPSRPADQPVDIVGGVRADQVASISTGGEWSMQIASQPSQAGAQAEYASLAKRYAKVLQGQPVNIVRAEIEGKGTFWRVRVPTNTKAEAQALCGKYKSAGGNCFVSR